MTTPAQAQFVEDFLLVAMNDQDTYNEMREATEAGTLSGAEKIQEQFEGWVSELAETEREKGNEFGALLLSQLLIGWGSDSFYKIALAFKDEELQDNFTETMSSLLKTQ